MKKQKYHGLTITIDNNIGISRNVLEAFLTNFFDLDKRLKGERLSTKIRNEFGFNTITIVQVMSASKAIIINDNWWEESFAVKRLENIKI